MDVLKGANKAYVKGEGKYNPAVLSVSSMRMFSKLFSLVVISILSTVNYSTHT